MGGNTTARPWDEFFILEEDLMIELKHVTKTFTSSTQQVHACKDVSLTIQDGDIFGIIGFSGAGKSTLVRCLNLLEHPTSGEVLFDGVDITKLNEKELRKVRKKIGMIFQHFNLMPSRTVAQNISYPLKGSKLSKKEMDQKVDELLELVDLKEKKNAYPSQLSGGQKQRVAIARALASEPSVLLCDEATSALDPQTTQSILSLLKNINQKLNLTIVLITHEMAVIKSICNQVAVMENGKVVEQGNIYDLFANPKQEVTQNFVLTTSNLSRLYEMIETNNPLVQLKENEKLILLNYANNNADKALISEVSRNFSVDTSIVFGNVEVIDNRPLGSLAIIIGGEKVNIEGAIAYFEDYGVKVEVLK